MLPTETVVAGTSVEARGGLTWLLTDGKPGHVAQLRGLAQALGQRQLSRIEWVDVASQHTGWLDLLRGTYPGFPRADAPVLAVAAGHGTHRPLLALGRASGCMTCVLMRPSLPLRCFDAAIIPRHDRPPVSSRVLVTEGALNPVTPVQHPDASCGLILLGGPSRHYDFPIASVCRQVESLCRHFPQVQWTASTSRRTPPGVLDALGRRTGGNLLTVDYRDTPSDWMLHMLSRCAQAWVTEDSVSMVYEALSAGLTTGLIALPARRNGRLQQGLRELQRTAPLNRLADVLAGQQPQRPRRPLQEAQRAADWLVLRLRREART